MPEIIVKYKNKRTLEALKEFAKYFDLEILLARSKKKDNQMNLNGITIIPGDSSIDINDLSNIFSGRNIDPLALRKKEWQRKK